MDFINLHKFVTLVADVIFVNDVKFLITVSHDIKFVMIEHIPTRTAKQLTKSLNWVMKIYSRNVMIVHTILMDMKFDKTVGKLMGNDVVNTSAAKEHIV